MRSDLCVIMSWHLPWDPGLLFLAKQTEKGHISVPEDLLFWNVDLVILESASCCGFSHGYNRHAVLIPKQSHNRIQVTHKATKLVYWLCLSGYKFQIFLQWNWKALHPEFCGYFESVLASNKTGGNNSTHKTLLSIQYFSDTLSNDGLLKHLARSITIGKFLPYMWGTGSPVDILASFWNSEIIWAFHLSHQSHSATTQRN